MLMLTRKTGERITINAGGRQITIEVVEIKGNHTVRLGFDAPLDVPIVRDNAKKTTALRAAIDGAHAATE